MDLKKQTNVVAKETIKSNKVENILLICAVCLIPLIFGFDPDSPFYNIKSTLSVSLSAIMLIVHILNKNKPKFKNKPLLIASIILLILVLLSVIFSVDISESVYGSKIRYEGILPILSYFILFYISFSYFKQTRQLNILFCIVCFFIFIYGILQFFGIEPILNSKNISYTPDVPCSTIGHRDFFGSFLTLVFPIFLYYFIKKGYIHGYILLCLSYFCILATGCRSAWLGTFLTFLLFIYYFIKHKLNIRRLSYVLCGLMLITIFHLFAPAFLPHLQNNSMAFPNRLMYAATDTTGAGRIYIWEMTTGLVEKKPILGYGPETLGESIDKAYKDRKYFINCYVDRAHNEYLHIAYSSGIPAALLYIGILCYIILKALQKAKTNAILVPLVCAITGYAIQAFFNIRVAAVAPVFFIFLGITCKLTEEKTDSIIMNE